MTLQSQEIKTAVFKMSQPTSEACSVVGEHLGASETIFYKLTTGGKLRGGARERAPNPPTPRAEPGFHGTARGSLHAGPRKALPTPSTLVPRAERSRPDAGPAAQRPSGPAPAPSRSPRAVAGHAAASPLPGPRQLRLHAHTGRTGRRLSSSRGQGLRRRTERSESIRGCSRARRLLHGGAPRGTCPGRPTTTAAAGTQGRRREPGRGRLTPEAPRTRRAAQRRPLRREPSCGFRFLEAALVPESRGSRGSRGARGARRAGLARKLANRLIKIKVPRAAFLNCEFPRAFSAISPAVP